MVSKGEKKVWSQQSGRRVMAKNSRRCPSRGGDQHMTNARFRISGGPVFDIRLCLMTERSANSEGQGDHDARLTAQERDRRPARTGRVVTLHQRSRGRRSGFDGYGGDHRFCHTHHRQQTDGKGGETRSPETAQGTCICVGACVCLCVGACACLFSNPKTWSITSFFEFVPLYWSKVSTLVFLSVVDDLCIYCIIAIWNDCLYQTLKLWLGNTKYFVPQYCTLFSRIPRYPVNMDHP